MRGGRGTTGRSNYRGGRGDYYGGRGRGGRSFDSAEVVKKGETKINNIHDLFVAMKKKVLKLYG